jgi:hypothetical protein
MDEWFVVLAAVRFALEAAARQLPGYRAHKIGQKFLNSAMLQGAALRYFIYLGDLIACP